jgi:4-hydroxy-tetrahydrodipicolinate reductase
MNILIIGYGKMGREVEKLLLQHGHQIAGIIDTPEDRSSFRADAAIEFSTPQTATDNILWCLRNNIPVVCGTTGWHHDLPLITDECSKYDGTFLWGTNFSIGMNVMFFMNSQLVKIMNNFRDYKAVISETHHVQKLDKPSGTAITLAQGLTQESTLYTHWTCNKEQPEEDELPVISVREGDVKGIHIVKYENDADIISIQHEAKTRQGFALGAMMACLWLTGKRGVFTFQDFFNDLANNEEQK